MKKTDTKVSFYVPEKIKEKIRRIYEKIKTREGVKLQEMDSAR